MTSAFGRSSSCTGLGFVLARHLGTARRLHWSRRSSAAPVVRLSQGARRHRTRGRSKMRATGWIAYMVHLRRPTASKNQLFKGTGPLDTGSAGSRSVPAATVTSTRADVNAHRDLINDDASPEHRPCERVSACRGRREEGLSSGHVAHVRSRKSAGSRAAWTTGLRSLALGVARLPHTTCRHRPRSRRTRAHRTAYAGDKQRNDDQHQPTHHQDMWSIRDGNGFGDTAGVS